MASYRLFCTQRFLEQRRKLKEHRPFKIVRHIFYQWTLIKNLSYTPRWASHFSHPPLLFFRLVLNRKCFRQCLSFIATWDTTLKISFSEFNLFMLFYSRYCMQDSCNYESNVYPCLSIINSVYITNDAELLFTRIGRHEFIERKRIQCTELYQCQRNQKLKQRNKIINFQLNNEWQISCYTRERCETGFCVWPKK